MTRPLFEQYKDALRRGHVAARGSGSDDALAAYAEAARLAPDRAAPYTSAAVVLHRTGRDAEALAAFERALSVAPDDEATLRARAAMHRELGRLASAAADLERLAEALDADGRRRDALAAAREAVSLTATATRRALVERLELPQDEAAPRSRPVQPVRPVQPARPPTRPATPAPIAATPAAPDADASPPTVEPTAPRRSTLMDLYDEPIADEFEAAPVPAIEGAATLAEPATAMADAIEPAAASEAAASEAAASAPSGSVGAGLPDAFEAAISDPGSAPLMPDLAGLARPAPSRVVLESLRDPGSESLIQLEPDIDASASIPWPAIDLPSAPPPPIVGPPPDPDVLMAEALAHIDSGDPKAARNLLLTAVAVHRAAGRPDAALDVCLQLLALAPGDAHVHLAIAGLQLDRGWRTLATEKIQLLLRLTALTGDTQAEADAHALAAERLRDEAPSSFARA